MMLFRVLKYNRLFVASMLCSLALCSACSQYKVYSVRDNPTLPVSGGILYALPQTHLRIDITVERRDLSRAPFSAYAVELLGVDSADVDTHFRIAGLDLAGVNVADPDFYYYVKVRRGSVSVDSRHLLLAVGMDSQSDVAESLPTASQTVSSTNSIALRAAYNLYDRTDTFYTRYDAPGHPSMLSSRKDVRSVRQRALSAAERLEEVQEKQRQLLEGEYEGAYGVEAVQYLYGQLHEQEQDIIASFCGNMTRETVSFYVNPQMKRGVDFCDTVVWFSPSEGFVGDDGQLPSDACPVVCTVQDNNTLRRTTRFVKYQTAGYTSNSSIMRSGRTATLGRGRKTFRYRVPEQASVSVSAAQWTLRRQVPLSQLGPIVELPRHRIHARFDAQTLDLIFLNRGSARK